MEIGSVDSIALAAMNIKQVETLTEVSTSVLHTFADSFDVV